MDNKFSDFSIITGTTVFHKGDPKFGAKPEG